MDTYESVKQKMNKGLFPATPIPFNSKGSIDVNSHMKYVNYIKNEPISGVAVWAHTGRGLLIDDETRDYVLCSFREALPDKLIIAGVGADINKFKDKENFESQYISQAIKMAQRAKELNADAIMVYAPNIFKGQEDQDKKIIEYHKEIAKVGLPIILFYLYEEAGGISYSYNVLNELLNMKEIIGIKVATLDSIMTYQYISSYIQKNYEDKLLITGEDRMLGYTLMRGAKASLIGLGCACTKLQKDLMESYYHGHFDRFINLSLKVDKLAECTFIDPMEGYIKRMLTVLGILGIIPMEATYDPFGPISELSLDEIRHIEGVLKEIDCI